MWKTMPGSVSSRPYLSLESIGTVLVMDRETPNAHGYPTKESTSRRNDEVGSPQEGGKRFTNEQSKGA